MFTGFGFDKRMRLGGSSKDKDRKAVLADARRKRAARKAERQRQKNATKLQGFARWVAVAAVRVACSSLSRLVAGMCLASGRMDVHRRREKSREDWDRKIRDVERVRAMFAKVKKPFVAPAKYGAVPTRAQTQRPHAIVCVCMCVCCRTQAVLLSQLLFFCRTGNANDAGRVLTMCELLLQGCRSPVPATNFCSLALRADASDSARWMYRVTKLTFVYVRGADVGLYVLFISCRSGCFVFVTAGASPSSHAGRTLSSSRQRARRPCWAHSSPSSPTCSPSSFRRPGGLSKSAPPRLPTWALCGRVCSTRSCGSTRCSPWCGRRRERWRHASCRPDQTTVPTATCSGCCVR